jgi:enoyl-CoA hydratase/carnithine racemase
MTDVADRILTSTANGVMTIRMNRPDKKNALTGDMYSRLSAGLDEANSNDDINAILILGAPGSFSSGNDIADFMQVAMSGERENMSVFGFLERIIQAPKPIVAGVDGLAIGVGTTMLMHCDYVVASDASLVKTPCVDLGLVPEAGSSLIGPEITGYHKAFSLLVMGEGFSAEDAKDAGFVTKISSSQDLEATALQAAEELASKPQQALKLSRDLLRGDRSDVLARMREEAVLFGERLESEEAKQAFMSFMQKGAKKAS